MMDIQSLFKLGMKRDLPQLLEFSGITYNIGSSPTDFWKIPGAIALGRPDWNWPTMEQQPDEEGPPIMTPSRIPSDDATVSTIHCYHFLEHQTGENAIALLRECERVMIPSRSVMNFCVPYYSSSMQAHDLTHKSFWCEDTFKTLLEEKYYSPAGKWKLRVHFLMIAGVVGRNTCLIGQLVRDE